MATYINPNAIKDRSITSIKLADGLIVTDASIAALGYIKDVSNLATKNAAIGSLSLALDSTNYKITLSGTKVDGSAFTVQNVIDLPLESVVVDGSYNNTTKKVVLTLQNGSTVDFSVADLVAGLQSEITSTNKLSADLIQDGTTNKTVTATEKQTWNNAVQPADLSTVATTGAYSDLSGVPAPTTDASIAAWGYAKDASLLFKRAAGTNSVMVINNSNVDASITGTSAVALGMKCVIKGSYGCVAEGSENTIAANTNSCHAEGCYNTINYGGDYSHIEGYHNTTSGFASHVGGYYTMAQNHSEHASGKYNKSHYTSRGANLDPSPDASLNTLFSIGNGISENARKNAMEIMYNGDVYITGIGNYDGSNYIDASTLQEVINNGSGNVTDFMTNVTYSELKALRDSSALIPGMQYRITDYECTTTQMDTSVAGHVFDIIVIADSSTVLNENARATWHDGDTYFQNCKLDKWQIMYTIDNDEFFSWADTNAGKGVIYYMKDEYCNECQYDFKNILFKRWEVTDASLTSLIVGHEDNPAGLYYGVKDSYEDGEYYEQTPHNAVFSSNTGYFYTFDLKDVSSGISYDMTVKSSDGLYGVCLSNCITSAALGINGIGYVLPNVIFLNSHPDITSQDILDEIPRCICNYIENSVSATFGNSCSNNILKNFAFLNTFGSYCSNNILTTTSNNIYANYCGENISDGNYIMLEKLAVGNKIGKGCSNIEIGENSRSNLIYTDTYDINIGANSNANIFYGFNYDIKIGNYSGGNLFYSSVSEITFGTSETVKDQYNSIIIEQGNRGIFLNCTATLGVSDYYRNIKILQGTHMTNNPFKTINDSNKNQTYQTVYQPANSLVISV